MNLLEYIVLALTAWFLGFFPLAEIYVAIPAALAMGLDPVSVFFWCVFGNFTPLLLIHLFYEQMIRNERLQRWLNRFTSPKFKEKVDSHGTWFVLVATPWTGVWVMGVTAKLLGMDTRKLLWTSLVSITVYGVVLVALIQSGIAFLSSG
jgi:uncharacterized membrane protein